MWSGEAAMMRGDARPAGGHRLGRRDRDGGARRRDRRCPPWRTFDDLRALSWQQFEEIIADAFRRHGDRVQETGWAGRRGWWRRPGADPQRGTVRGASQALAGEPGGVQPVRELYGVQRAIRGALDVRRRRLVHRRRVSVRHPGGHDARRR